MTDCLLHLTAYGSTLVVTEADEAIDWVNSAAGGNATTNDEIHAKLTIRYNIIQINSKYVNTL